MIDLPRELRERAARLVPQLAERGVRIALAESCTGGLASAILTDVPGSSAVLDRGFVTYSNAAKTELLAVPAELIEARGAVSKEVARAMAEGALAASHASAAVSITGVAGPGGGSAAKPVGLVHFALATRTGTRSVEHRFGERPRSDIRLAAVGVALGLLESLVQADAATDAAERP